MLRDCAQYYMPDNFKVLINLHSVHLFYTLKFMTSKIMHVNYGSLILLCGSRPCHGEELLLCTSGLYIGNFIVLVGPHLVNRSERRHESKSKSKLLQKIEKRLSIPCPDLSYQDQPMETSMLRCLKASV